MKTKKGKQKKQRENPGFENQCFPSFKFWVRVSKILEILRNYENLVFVTGLPFFV